MKEQTEYKYDLKIPKERIAVLIGKKGEIKSLIEKDTKTKLDIDSSEGDVSVSGKDALKLFIAREVITAVGRGFNPEIAMNLTKVDYVFDLININELAKSKNDMARIKGRIIGQEGKARRVIEELTGCDICVYGKTAAIIGPAEKVPLARKAVEMLIHGSKHAHVYKYLEKQKRGMKMENIKGILSRQH